MKNDHFSRKILKRVHQFIIQNELFSKKDKILIGLSSGVDSVVATHILYSLNYDIAASHVNFQLREAANDDEKFAKSLADELDLPFFFIRFDTQGFAEKNKYSIQKAAHELRYDWWKKLLDEHGFSNIVTAHHLDDNAETLLYNFAKSADYQLFKPIPLQNKNIVRPLMCLTRQEIEQFAKRNNLEFREDESNASVKYQRNRIRLNILPEFREINPSFVEKLNESAKLYNLQFQFFKEILAKEFDLYFEQRKNYFVFNLNKVEEQFSGYLPLFLHFLLRKFRIQAHFFEELQKLVNAETGAIKELGEFVFVKNRGELLFQKAEIFNNLPEKAILDLNVQQKFGFYKIEINLIEKSDELDLEQNENTYFLDFEKLKFPLTIRLWQKSDRFQAFGNHFQKKISDILVDNKVNRIQKNTTFVLEDAEKIAFLSNYRISETVKITKNTKQILKLTVLQDNE